VTEPNVATNPTAEWTEAQERARQAAEEERKHLEVRLPEGSFVTVDLDNAPARTKVRAGCGGREPGPDRGSYGVLLRFTRDEHGHPTSATVRLLDRASGVVHGMPLSALTRTDYRDTRELRGAA